MGYYEDEDVSGIWIYWVKRECICVETTIGGGTSSIYFMEEQKRLQTACSEVIFDWKRRRMFKRKGEEGIIYPIEATVNGYIRGIYPVFIFFVAISYSREMK